MKIAYVVSLFPKISETFILHELESLRERGEDLVVVSLKSGEEPLRHQGVEPFLESLVRAPSPIAALGAFVAFALERPGAAFGTLAKVTLAHIGHPLLLARAVPLVFVGAAVARRLRAMGVEHVHAHWATYPAQVAWTVRALAGIPYSITAHAHDIFLPNPMLREKIEGSVFTVAISEFNRRWIADGCGRKAGERIRIVRCGVPLRRFPPRNGAAPVEGIVSVGRLVDYKGFPTLIDAIRILHSEGRRVPCTIVGDGPERGRLRALIEASDLGGLVSLAGVKTRDEVREALAGAALCVLASERGHDGQMDGVPVVLMEAMALGVPCVSTRISGIPELVEHGVTGLLTPPGDARALASAIGRLLDEEGLAASVAGAARRKVEAEYDSEANAGRLLSLMRGRESEIA
jgi:glycosyltransferase involved in cell wall biosynthesis